MLTANELDAPGLNYSQPRWMNIENTENIEDIGLKLSRFAHYWRRSYQRDILHQAFIHQAILNVYKSSLLAAAIVIW